MIVLRELRRPVAAIHRYDEHVRRKQTLGHSRLRHIRLLDDYADLEFLQGVTPHSFRRTVATEIDEVYDAEAAKNQLGHTSKAVTERHYINRKLVVPDYRAATERLAPGSGADDDPSLGP
jgi:integrase